MTRRTIPLLTALAVAVIAWGALAASGTTSIAANQGSVRDAGSIAAPTAAPLAYFTANLPTPVPAETVTPMELALLDRIAGAQLSIEAAFYDFDRPSIRDALIAAHQRGVTVRVVTDRETVTGADAPYVAALVNAGIPVVDDGSAARTLWEDAASREMDAALAAPIMHSKYLVFDGQAVWTGSTNLSTNDLTRNHNNAVAFDSAEMAQVYRYDFEQMFAGQFTSAKTPSITTTVDYQGAPVEVYFAPQDEPMQRVIAAVNGAQTSIDFAIFYFTDDALADALIAARERGVRVRGLWDNLGAANAFSEDERLCAAGVPIKTEDTVGIMHHKFMAIDAAGVNPKTITGSLNWTAAADDANSENTVIVHDAGLAQTFAGAFQGMWDGLVGVAPCAPEAAAELVFLPLVAQSGGAPTPVPTETPPPADAVRLTRIVYDPPGADAEGERVTLRNVGNAPADLTGWTLADAANQRFTFPAVALAPDAALNVWVKDGVNTATDLYWGRGSAVWNNDGDTATLTDAMGAVVDACAYAGDATGEAACD